jgi:hypothetical protein
MINFLAGLRAFGNAIRAEFTIVPSNCTEMVDAGLLVWKRVHKIKKTVEVCDHGAPLPFGIFDF